MNLHDLVNKLTKELNLTPEQQFKITADIKRYVHWQKASVFHRYFMYSQGPGIFDRTDPENPKLIGYEPGGNPWLTKILEEKWKQHTNMAKNLPDEELVTWDVGSHKYK